MSTTMDTELIREMEEAQDVLGLSDITQIVECWGLRELGRRDSGGLEIALWWNPVADVVGVTVYDHHQGKLTIHGQIDKADANEAFEHPYLYGRAV